MAETLAAASAVATDELLEGRGCLRPAHFLLGTAARADDGAVGTVKDSSGSAEVGKSACRHCSVLADEDRVDAAAADDGPRTGAVQ